MTNEDLKQFKELCARHADKIGGDPEKARAFLRAEGLIDKDGNLSPPYNLHAANDNLPRVVALTGAAGSGKTTAADILIRDYGYVRVKFAAPLKAMCRAIGLTDEHIEGSLKEVPCAILQGKTPRYAMQTLGTEWGRDTIGPKFWTGLWEDAALGVLFAGERIVVDDCRFPNEAEVVREMGGVIYRLEGRGGIAGGHSSEKLSFDPDAVIHNFGGKEQLAGALAGLLAFWVAA